MAHHLKEFFHEIKQEIKEKISAKIKKHKQKTELALASIRALTDDSFATKMRDFDQKARSGSLGAQAKQGADEWLNAGKQEGIQIWRVEKFHIVSWPKEEYGKFYDGDSYIVLKTVKNAEGRFKWDVHFWLGTETSQDEAGTAAYKTVELDDLLGGSPVQHREVQDHESDLFKSYFQPAIEILQGGIETGFNHVTPEKYRPRLLLCRGKKIISVHQVDLTASSLNTYDAFVLDNGLHLTQWNGKKALIREKNKAGEIARAIKSERGGRPVVEVVEEGHEEEAFWQILGGRGQIGQEDESGDHDPNADVGNVRSLFVLKNGAYVEKAKGKITRNLFDTNEVYLFDNGYDIYVWIGKKATATERKVALPRAQAYLTQNNRPAYLNVTRISEGGESATFLEALDK